MNEDKFYVNNETETLAENMSLDSAIIFAKALFREFYNDEFEVIIGKMPKTKNDDMKVISNEY